MSEIAGVPGETPPDSAPPLLFDEFLAQTPYGQLGIDFAKAREHTIKHANSPLVLLEHMLHEDYRALGKMNDRFIELVEGDEDIDEKQSEGFAKGVNHITFALVLTTSEEFESYLKAMDEEAAEKCVPPVLDRIQDPEEYTQVKKEFRRYPGWWSMSEASDKNAQLVVPGVPSAVANVQQLYLKGTTAMLAGVAAAVRTQAFYADFPYLRRAA